MPDALPATQPTASKHWRPRVMQQSIIETNDTWPRPHTAYARSSQKIHDLLTLSDILACDMSGGISWMHAVVISTCMHKSLRDFDTTSVGKHFSSNVTITECKYPVSNKCVRSHDGSRMCHVCSKMCQLLHKWKQKKIVGRAIYANVVWLGIKWKCGG